MISSTRRGLVAPGLSVVLALGWLVAAAGPAAASTGQADVAVATPNGLFVAMQPDGAPASDWTVEKAAGGTWGSGNWAADWGTPSLYRQNTGGLVMTSIRGGDDSLWFFWQAPGATTWNAEEVGGSGSANPVLQPSIVSQAPLTAGQSTETAIVTNDSDAAYGQPNGAVMYWAVNGTSTWHEEQVPTATGEAVQPNISVAPNNTFLISFIAGGDGLSSTTNVEFGVDQTAGGGEAWSSEVRVNTAAPELQAASVIEGPSGNVEVAAEAVSGATYFFYSPAGKITTTWYQESVGSGNPSGTNPTGTVDSEQQPFALTGADSGNDVGALLGAGTCALAFYQPNGGSGWQQQTLGCSGYSTLPVLARDPVSDNEAAAAVDDAGYAHFYWQADGSTSWNAETIPGISGVNPNSGAGLAVN